MIPIVIPLHHGGGKLGDDTELRFALRSIEANLREPFEIAIVGKALPEWLTGVRHIPGAGLKSSLLAAADAYPAGFFWWYDDLCLNRPTDAEEMRITPACKGWTRAKTKWANQLERIRRRLVEEGHPSWDYSRPHGPYWFDKSMVEEGFADWPGMAAKFPWESWILSKRDWPRRHGVVRQFYGRFKNPPTAESAFLNYNDKGNTPELRDYLRSRFPTASQFEKPAEKNAISFCLFGPSRAYSEGAIENARLAAEIYPEWDSIFHVEAGHPAIPAIKRHGGIIHERPAEDGLRGTFWRFETLTWADRYQRVICRDADSRIGPRERVVVDDWIAAGTKLHSMCDSYRNLGRRIFAGMFGIQTAEAPWFAEELAAWGKSGRYGDDEDFLNRIVWPRLRHSATSHRRIPRRKGEIKFPAHAPDGHVGARGILPDIVSSTIPTYRIGAPGTANPGETLIPPVTGAGKQVGNALAHIQAARHALAEGIFPCVVLEEDAAWRQDLHELPATDSPWLWLGLSRYELGQDNKGRRGNPTRPIDGGLIDMGRMCATHGLAYTNPAGALRMIEGAIEAIARGVPIDVGIILIAEAKGWSRPGLPDPLVHQIGKNRADTDFALSE